MFTILVTSFSVSYSFDNLCDTKMWRKETNKKIHHKSYFASCRPRKLSMSANFSPSNWLFWHFEDTSSAVCTVTLVFMISQHTDLITGCLTYSPSERTGVERVAWSGEAWGFQVLNCGTLSFFWPSVIKIQFILYITVDHQQSQGIMSYPCISNIYI